MVPENGPESTTYPVYRDATIARVHPRTYTPYSVTRRPLKGRQTESYALIYPDGGAKLSGSLPRAISEG